MLAMLLAAAARLALLLVLPVTVFPVLALPVSVLSVSVLSVSVGGLPVWEILWLAGVWVGAELLVWLC